MCEDQIEAILMAILEHIHCQCNHGHKRNCFNSQWTARHLTEYRGFAKVTLHQMSSQHGYSYLFIPGDIMHAGDPVLTSIYMYDLVIHIRRSPTTKVENRSTNISIIPHAAYIHPNMLAQPAPEDSETAGENQAKPTYQQENPSQRQPPTPTSNPYSTPPWSSPSETTQAQYNSPLPAAAQTHSPTHASNATTPP